MRKTAGSDQVINAVPPYRGWDGNQATYLFFPVFISFLLVLLSSLSDPIINGLSVVHVNTHSNGTVRFGTWGWCSHGVPGVENKCSSNRAFGGSMEPELEQLPEALQTLADISMAIPDSYLIASGIMHVFACLAIGMTVTWSLAASGAWRNRDQHAWDWTRWAFAGTIWSSPFTLIAWSLDIGEVVRVRHKIFDTVGSIPDTKPGPAIWMIMVAFLLNIGTFIVRTTYLKYKPRPEWTTKAGGGDFHNAIQPPMSAALPPADELPPTWESLELDGPSVYDEKKALDEPGFAV